MRGTAVCTLLQITHPDHFGIPLFEIIYKHAKDYKKMMHRIEEKVIISIGFKK